MIIERIIYQKTLKNNQIDFVGGSTIFPYAGVSVTPEKGAGIMWKNLMLNEDADAQTTHRACPILEGTKTIGNKWIGYNNQWKNYKCGLEEAEIMKQPYDKA